MRCGLPAAPLGCEIMENIGLFACFPLMDARAPSRRPVGRRTFKKLSQVVRVVSFPKWPGLVVIVRPNTSPKKFSNHWKTREIFFQSLENPAHFFQPLEKYFPIIGKPHSPARPPDCAKPEPGSTAPPAPARSRSLGPLSLWMGRLVMAAWFGYDCKHEQNFRYWLPVCPTGVP